MLALGARRNRVNPMTASLPLAEIADNDPSYGLRLHEALNHLRDAAYDRDDILQFMAFAMPLARKSKAQLFQDLWALWVNGGKRGGYFVEFGAADGLNLSNTWMLEKEMGWSGLLAEPNPAFHEALARERDCEVSHKCVYSRSGETVDFMAARHGEFSRIASISPEDSHEEKRQRTSTTIAVETISLNDLLIERKAPRRIDFMSVDTEGSEFEILSQFDFDRWEVAAIAVEHNKTPARERLAGLLTAKGYRRMWVPVSRFDDWYVKAE